VAAQAAGDAAVLAEHGRPVLRLHLTDRSAGLAQLTALLGAQ
jgi:glucose-6-phosphate isomerase